MEKMEDKIEGHMGGEIEGMTESVCVCVCRGGGAGEVRDNPRAAVVNTGELNLHTYCQLLLSI